MTTDRETLRIIGSWLEDGRTRLPDHVLDTVLDQLPSTPQRRPSWPARRIAHVQALAKYAIAAAAVVVVAIISLNLLGAEFGRTGGVGTPPSPSPTATPRPDPDGDLQPGTYIVRPLPTPNDALTVEYTVPDGWSAIEGGALMPADEPGTTAPGGMGIEFIDVTSINDPCQWSGTADDVSLGPTVDDLVGALRAQTAYEVSDQVDVTIGGHSGKRVDIVMPTEPFQGQTPTAPGCDDEVFRPWSTTAHGPNPIYAQGPANRWQTNILDVDGTRLVIVVQDFPGTSPEDRAEMDAIVDSLVIEPGGG
jgi:hypothetical protein